MSPPRIALFAALALCSTESAVSAQDMICAWVAASSTERASTQCRNEIGGATCKTPVGGCNEEGQWGAVAAGIASDRHAVAVGIEVRGQTSTIVQTKALQACDRDADKQGIICRLIHTWSKGCGYVAQGCKSAAIAPEPSVRSDAALLRELRDRLYELNFDPTTTHAPFGEADRRAIREFEARNNLTQTGEVTVALLDRLRATGGQSPWGAIVFSKANGKWGMAWGHGTRKQAVISAMSSCGNARDCTIELSFFGSECGAFAYSGTNWALMARDSANEARQTALAECQKGGRRCRVVASVCANGSDRQAADK